MGRLDNRNAFSTSGFFWTLISSVSSKSSIPSSVKLPCLRFVPPTPMYCCSGAITFIDGPSSSSVSSSLDGAELELASLDGAELELELLPSLSCPGAFKLFLDLISSSISMSISSLFGKVFLSLDFSLAFFDSFTFWGSTCTSSRGSNLPTENILAVDW